LHAQIAVGIHNQGVVLDLDGMDFEPLQCNLVSGGCGGALKRRPEQVGGIHLHGRRDLVAQEWGQEEVELLTVTDAIHAGIAKADRFAVTDWGERDLGWQ